MAGPDNAKYPSETAALGAKVAQVVAWISGLFSLVVCITLIVNQIQTMVYDPLNDPSLKALKAAVAKDPQNQQLRESVRALSLISRRAFFTNQTQARAAGLLLLGGVAIFLASIKTFMELRRKNPVPVGQMPREGGLAELAAGRWAVAAGGGLLVVATLLVVYLSPPTLPIEIEAPPPAAEAPKAAPPGTEAKAPAADPGSKPAPAPAAKTPETPAAPEPVPATAWPAFRGPNGLGVALHKNAPVKWDGKTNENVRWKVAVPKAGSSSPIVWGGRVFLSTSDDDSRDVLCYDADSGKLLWQQQVKQVTGTLPKVMEGTTFSASTLATDGERVYAIFATGDLVAFAMDGTKAWAKNLGVPKNSYGYTSSLMTYPGRLLVQWDDQKGGHFVAFDPKTGNKLWDQAREVTESWATPVLVNTGSRVEAILNAKPFVVSHDPSTGKILWQAKCMEGGEVAPSVAWGKGLAFAVTDHVAMFGLKPGGEIAWKYDEDLPDVSSPVANDKYVVMASSGGVVTCLEAAGGKKVWSKDFDEGFYSSPILVDDRVYLLDKKGVGYVFKMADKYEELGRNELGDKSPSTPAIPDGRIYVRGEKNLYCIGKSGP